MALDFLTPQQPQLPVVPKKPFSPFGPPAPTGAEEQLAPPAQDAKTAFLAAQAAQQAKANEDAVMAQGGLPPAAKAAPVAASAPGSGLGESAGAKNTNGTSDSTANKEHDIKMLSRDQIAQSGQAWKDVADQLGVTGSEDALQRLIASQRGGAGSGPDWKVLAALGDSWQTRGGQGHTAEAFPQVETPQQRDARILAYTQKLAQDKRDMMNSIIKGMNIKGGFSETSDARKQTSAQETDDKKTAADPLANGKLATQSIQFARQTEREGKDIRSRGEIIDTALRMLNGTPTEQNSLPALAARIIEGTVRPQLAVIQREGGDASGWARLEQSLTKLANGQITPENVKQYTHMLENLAEQHQADVGAVRERWQTIANRLHLTPEEFESMVGDQWLNPHAGSTGKLIKQGAAAGDAPTATAPGAKPTGDAPKIQSIEDYSGQKR